MRVWCVLGLIGCAGDGGTDDTIPVDSSTPTPTIDARPLLERLEGIWRDFGAGRGELDVAITEDGWVFGRGEVPGGGTRRLRFGWTSEGSHVRDTSMEEDKAVDHTAFLEERTGDTWTFCGTSGCDALQIDITVDDKTLVMETSVPEEDTTTRLDGLRLADVDGGVLLHHAVSDPDPVLPDLTVTATWLVAETVATWGRVVVARTPCQTGCVPSRTFEQLVPSGQTSTTFEVPELHPGVYYLTVFLDRNHNANSGTSYRVDAADAFALPDQEVIVTGDVVVPVELINEL